jgi:hypothetical protein
MATLSALGILELTEQKRVARVDLAEAGYAGIVYVCDLTATQQQALAVPRNSKTVVNYKHNTMEMDLSALSGDTGARFMMACLVTDAKDGEILERAFAATQESFITIAKSDLVFIADLLRAELKSERAVQSKLEEMPNAVTELIVRTCREISGVARDAVEEKKDD